MRIFTQQEFASWERHILRPRDGSPCAKVLCVTPVAGDAASKSRSVRSTLRLLFRKKIVGRNGADAMAGDVSILLSWRLFSS